MKLKKSPSQARAQETVQKIIDAANNLMLKSGVTSLTIRKVAKEAGLGVGSIYDYFPNKQALMEEICEQRLAHRLEVFEKTLLQSSNKDMSEELAAYRSEVDKAHLSSRLGIELRHYSEQNPGLRKIVKKYEKKLTDSLSSFLKKHAPSMPEKKRDILANYMMNIDYMTMNLLLHSSNEEAKLYSDLQAQVKKFLLQEAGFEPTSSPSPDSKKIDIIENLHPFLHPQLSK